MRKALLHNTVLPPAPPPPPEILISDGLKGFKACLLLHLNDEKTYNQITIEQLARWREKGLNRAKKAAQEMAMKIQQREIRMSIQACLNEPASYGHEVLDNVIRLLKKRKGIKIQVVDSTFTVLFENLENLHRELLVRTSSIQEYRLHTSLDETREKLKVMARELSEARPETLLEALLPIYLTLGSFTGLAATVRTSLRVEIVNLASQCLLCISREAAPFAEVDSKLQELATKDCGDEKASKERFWLKVKSNLACSLVQRRKEEIKSNSAYQEAAMIAQERQELTAGVPNPSCSGMGARQQAAWDAVGILEQVPSRPDGIPPQVFLDALERAKQTPGPRVGRQQSPRGYSVGQVPSILLAPPPPSGSLLTPSAPPQDTQDTRRSFLS